MFNSPDWLTNCSSNNNAHLTFPPLRPSPPPPSPAHTRPPTRFSEETTDLEYVQYDLDDLDLNWLESVNQKRKFRGQLNLLLY